MGFSWEACIQDTQLEPRQSWLCGCIGIASGIGVLLRERSPLENACGNDVTVRWRLGSYLCIVVVVCGLLA